MAMLVYQRVYYKYIIIPLVIHIVFEEMICLWI